MLSGIIGCLGPEGSGKTALMTALSLKHHRDGGKVFAFPGYELKVRGKVVSTTISPEEALTLPQTTKNVLIDIDEAQISLNSLHHQDTLAELFTSVAALRRHYGLSICYCIQEWGWYNNRLRALTHVLFNCWDLFWTYRMTENPLPRGEQLAITPIDVKGFYTGRPWTRGNTRIFHARRVWGNFDTHNPFDIMGGRVRIKHDRREVTLGADGQVVPMGADRAPAVNMDAIGKLAERYSPDATMQAVKEVVDAVKNSIKAKGVSRIPAADLQRFIAEQGLNLSNIKLGRYLRPLGVVFISGTRGAQNAYEFR